RKVDFPGEPAVLDPFHEGNVVLRREGIRPGGEGTAVRRLPFLVAVADQAEGVVVPAHPEVEAVLLDPLSPGGIPPAAAVAPEALAELEDGDLIALAELRRRGERKGGRE